MVACMCLIIHTAPHDKDLSGRYLKWTFTKTKDELGIYFDYQVLQDEILVCHLHP